MVRFYWLVAATTAAELRKHPPKLTRRQRGRKARTTRAQTEQNKNGTNNAIVYGPIESTPMFPQLPREILMKPKPSFARKKTEDYGVERD